MKVAEALQGLSSVFVDTAPIIYHLEGNPAYKVLMREFFRLRKDKGITLVTSPVTLAECLVHPIQKGMADLETAYCRLIIAGENTEFRLIGDLEAREAARLRARHNLLLADAFQLAIALQAGAQAILTNDPVFKRANEIRALILDEMEP